MNTDKIFAEAIANEYAPKDTSKVIALRKLEGMCLSVQAVGCGGILMTGVGVLLGIPGIAGAGLNYPIRKKLLRSGKEKYAFDILQLAREYLRPCPEAVRDPGCPPSLLHRLLYRRHRRHCQGVAAAGLRG